MKHPCMTVWPEKFFGDTSHVQPEVQGLYMLMLMHAWGRGGSLPNDDAAIRRLLRLSPWKWAQRRQELMSFWTLGEDNRWHQKRLDIEYQRADERRPGRPDDLEKPNPPIERPRVKKPNLAYARARRAARAKETNGSSFFDPEGAKKLETLGVKKPNDNYARARSGDPTPIREDLCLTRQRDLPLAAQSLSEPPAPLRSLKALAPRAAPDAVFLRQGSPEWRAYEAEHGPISAHSMHDGDPGRWVKR